MTIGTKYNIGDTVYKIDGSTIMEHQITSMKIEVCNKEVVININYNGTRENELYPTKQEAGEAWMKQNGLEVGIK